MKTSIVTISFNQSRFLAEAICSVLDQKEADVEYIVVDPGSTDGSRDIIEKYRHLLSHVIYERDEGPADGLNKGFQLATGDILAFLNSDDLLLPGAVTNAVQFLSTHRDIDVVSGHAVIADAQGRRRRISHSDRFSLKAVAYGACVLMQPSTFFRASAFRKAGGFNRENRSNWDGELFIDIALSGGRFARANDIWSVYRVHEESITGSAKLERALEQYRHRMFSKIMQRSRRPSDAIASALYRARKHISTPSGIYQRLAFGPVYGSARIGGQSSR